MRSRAAQFVVAALLITAVGCGGGSSGSKSKDDPNFAKQTAQQILDATVSAALSQGAVHYESRVTGGKQVFRFIGDAGHAQGRQRIRSHGIDVVLIFINKVLYLRGGASGYAYALKITKEKATPYKEQTLAVTAKDKRYAGLIKGLTIESRTDGWKQLSALQTGAEKLIGDANTIGITGNDREGRAHTLYVTLSTPHVVVEEDISGTPMAVALYTHWGTTFPIKLPATSIPAPS